jgi:hypothetical protein
VRRYYVVEDTCVECSEDWRRNKPHVDLYVSGSGKKLAECEDRLTIKNAKIIAGYVRILLYSSGTAPAGETDPRDRLGFAIAELLCQQGRRPWHVRRCHCHGRATKLKQ